MKAGRLSLLLLVAVAIGFTLGGERSERKAIAQAPGVNPNGPGQYQISSVGNSCFMVDTHTGQLWRFGSVGDKFEGPMWVWEEFMKPLPQKR